MLRMLEQGVLDHVTKPLSGMLLCAKVRLVCERSRMQRELKNKLQFALENAAHDPLTGLFNRRYFERRLREESAHARRHRRPFSIVMLDLDHFKLVNDAYGHEDGDRVLRHVSEVIQAMLREDDVSCRYGGEEFVLLLRGTTGMAARVVANRLRATLAAKSIALGAKEEPRHVTFSAGVAAADDRNTYNADDIVARADAALYRAKRAGRNRVETE
jgi:two-component system cell cycle response regulator